MLFIKNKKLFLCVTLFIAIFFVNNYSMRDFSLQEGGFDESCLEPVEYLAKLKSYVEQNKKQYGFLKFDGENIQMPEPNEFVVQLECRQYKKDNFVLKMFELYDYLIREHSILKNEKSLEIISNAALLYAQMSDNIEIKRSALYIMRALVEQNRYYYSKAERAAYSCVKNENACLIKIAQGILYLIHRHKEIESGGKAQSSERGYF